MGALQHLSAEECPRGGRGASRAGLLVGHFEVGFAGFLDEVDQRVDSLAHDRLSFVLRYREMHFH